MRKRMNYGKALGDHGEVFAANVLQEMGYEILTTKYRTRMGEVDIIARENGVYHFVEVKTRIGNEYGNPEEAVDSLKQQRIAKASEFFLMRNNLRDVPVQFDVIAIGMELLMGCF